MKMLTHDKEFNYEQPEMEYDKKTGDVKIFEKRNKRKKILRNHDEVN